MSNEQHIVGAASEFLVAHILSQRGHDVFFPNTPARADLIYVDGVQTVRAQVKTATRSETAPYCYEQCRLRARKKKGDPTYTADEIDEIWVVGTHVWCFPIELVAGRPSLALTGNGPRAGTNPEYCPEEHIVFRGTWENPARNIFC